MKQEIRDALSKYFDNLDQLNDEINEVERAFDALGLSEGILDDVTFWNHTLALVQRVYTGTQNELEFENSGEISEGSIEKARALMNEVSFMESNTLKEFETYLLAIYFEKEEENVK